MIKLNLKIEPKQIQEASAAAQQLGIFVHALISSYNSCAITQQQYYEGLFKVYPRLESDIGHLDVIRKNIAQKRPQPGEAEAFFDDFCENLFRLAEIPRLEKRVESLSLKYKKHDKDIKELKEKQRQMQAEQADQKAKIIELQRLVSPLKKPEDIPSEISKRLEEKKEEAGKSYAEGYRLFQKDDFIGALPFLLEAVNAVPITPFYVALARNYWELLDVDKAESTLRDALKDPRLNTADKALIDNELALTLYLRGSDGDLKEAASLLTEAISLLNADEFFSPDRALYLRNLGVIYLTHNELDKALACEHQALTIDKQLSIGNFLTNPMVAIDNETIGGILHRKGESKLALSYSQDAYLGFLATFGAQSPMTIDAMLSVANNQIGIADDVSLSNEERKKAFESAQDYAHRIAGVAESLPPDSPIVARMKRTIGLILVRVGQFDEALSSYFEALDIEKKRSNYPSIALTEADISQAYARKAKVEEQKKHWKYSVEVWNKAIEYGERAKKSHTLVYGEHSEQVKEDNHLIALYKQRIEANSQREPRKPLLQ